jgi:hypothetical protein
MPSDNLNPNDKRDEKGNIVPQDAAVIAKRLAKMRDTSPGKVVGYKVAYPWTMGPADPNPPRHKAGEKLAPGDVYVPDGYDRTDLIAELVRNGNLVPEYEKKADDKQPAPEPATPPAEGDIVARPAVVLEAPRNPVPPSAGGSANK